MSGTITMPSEACIERWRQDPEAFIREVLGVELEPWQREYLRAMRATGERRRTVYVRPRW